MPSIQTLKKFSFTRVVTKNIVTDSFQSIRNLFGLRLRGYEQMIQKSIEEVMVEAEARYQIREYRYIVNPLTNGSAMIILYGEGVPYE